jgi:branched-chain amino acid transport system substrate-binding protein
MPAEYGWRPMSDLRRVGAGIAAICLLLGLGACGEEQEPIQVGVLIECVGPLAGSEQTMFAAAELPFLERGARLHGDDPTDGLDDAKVGGRPLELLVGCTIQSDQVRQIVETRRLIEDEGADVIIGPVGEAEGVLVRRLSERYPNVTFVLGVSAAQETTLRDSQPNVFRFVADGAQSAAGLATHAFRDLGWRRAAVAMDPAAGSWEAAAGFVAEFCALGGTIESRELLVVPGPAADRATGARLARGVDGTALFDSWEGVGDFLRSYGQHAGPLPRRLVVNGFAFARPGGLSPGGVDLSGVVWGNDLPLESERPQWRRYRRAFARAFPRLPRESATGLIELPVYLGAEALARALERVDGAVGPHGARLRAALSKVAFDGPAGPVLLDHNRQAIVSVHLRRIEGRGKRARTVPFRVERDVDQSFGGAFNASTRAPSLDSPKCRRGPVPEWALD